MTVRIAIAMVLVLGHAPPLGEGLTAQEEEAGESAGGAFGLVLVPYAGVADNPREEKLPVSPMGGMRITGEVWLSLPNSIRFAPFFGVAGSVLAVNGGGGLEVEYLTTAEAGIKLDVPGQPYLTGFFGRAYPAAEQTWDPQLQRWVGGESAVFGGGVGLSPVIGRSAFNFEGRYRRDRRFAAGLDHSVEIIVGFPAWIGGSR